MSADEIIGGGGGEWIVVDDDAAIGDGGLDYRRFCSSLSLRWSSEDHCFDESGGIFVS